MFLFSCFRVLLFSCFFPKNNFLSGVLTLKSPKCIASCFLLILLVCCFPAFGNDAWSKPLNMFLQLEITFPSIEWKAKNAVDTDTANQVDFRSCKPFPSRANKHVGMDQYLLIPFLGGWTSINPSYFDVHQGYKVLTHCHVCLVGIVPDAPAPMEWDDKTSRACLWFCLCWY